MRRIALSVGLCLLVSAHTGGEYATPTTAATHSSPLSMTARAPASPHDSVSGPDSGPVGMVRRDWISPAGDEPIWPVPAAPHSCVRAVGVNASSLRGPGRATCARVQASTWYRLMGVAPGDGVRAPGGDVAPKPDGTGSGAGMLVEWAVRRFEAAGLALPSVTVFFFDDDACKGAAGLYLDSGAAAIVCNRGGHSNPTRQTLLHELAHAWISYALTEAEISAFLSDQDLEDWMRVGDPFWRRGVERAAEVVAWGLQDSVQEDRSIWTAGKNCTDLSRAFRLLAGSEPLNDSPNFCAATSAQESRN